MLTKTRLEWLLTIASIGLFATPASAAQSYDLVLQGGTVVDGSGAPRRVADVGVRAGRIIAIGDLRGASALQRRDVRGLIVAPGFINIHDHLEMDALATASNMLGQGVTTEFPFADGGGPLDPVAEVTEAFAKTGSRVNVGAFVGFNDTWQAIVGESSKRATPAEIARMQASLVTALRSGAFGISAGLDFAPGSNAPPEQVAEILKPAATWRVVFQNHERLDAANGFSSLNGSTETLAIGRTSGVYASITHIKSQGHEQGGAAKLLGRMDAEIRAGHPTFGDVYPYLAGMTSTALLVPAWAQIGGLEPMLARFKDPAQRARIITETEEAMRARFKGPAGMFFLESREEMTDVMRKQGIGAGESLLRAIEAGQRNIIARFGVESDIETFLRWPDMAIECDCGGTLKTNVHPRVYGAFPRLLGVYVRERGVLSWEEAIRKMTSVPAGQAGLIDRGLLAPGMAADIVVFDPDRIADRSTFEKPAKPSVGVELVFVNGRLALERGQLTAQGARAGILLRRPAFAASRSQSRAPITVYARGRLEDGRAFEIALRRSTAGVSGTVRLPGKLNLRGRIAGTLQTATGWAALIGVDQDRPFNLIIDTKGPEGAAVIVERSGVRSIGKLAAGYSMTIAGD